MQSHSNFFQNSAYSNYDGERTNILSAISYERLKTLMLGTTLKLDSTMVAFKGLVSDIELNQHIDQDFYYEFDKLLFVYSRSIGDDRYN